MTAESLPRKITANWNPATAENFGVKPESVAIKFETKIDDANKSASTANAQNQPHSGGDVRLTRDPVLNILMIEDCRDDCDLICFHLRKCGFTVRVERVFCEETMSAALALRRWDLVFTDHGLPGFTGVEAIALLRKMELQIPVICITGNSDPVIIRKILAAGARACINKNDLSLLCMTVERALTKRSTFETDPR